VALIQQQLMNKLFSPLTIKGISFKNRIVVSPMCQYSAIDGFASDWHLVHLGSRAVGGAALILQEATAISPEGRISYGDLGIWKDEHIEKLKQIVSFVQSHGAIMGIQLAHAGRKASCEVPWLGGKQIQSGEKSWQTVAPSPVPFHQTDILPVALSIDDIEKIIDDFKTATLRCINAGYKVVEIHAAHGYLIHQFLSPLSNKRADEYGGCFENRIRLLSQIIENVQQFWPSDLPLFVRISATDWSDSKDSWTIAESIKLAGILKAKGVDLIDTSSGGLVPHVKIPVGPGYQLPFSEQIKKESGIFTGAVGMITEAKQAENILQKGQADMIIIAREMLRNPYLPLNWAREMDESIEWPAQYLRARL
jgi:2,4-dienoyl-CoA reductase-like NADH-dependent reductase (Old Yellow Enzyme family)